MNDSLQAFSDWLAGTPLSLVIQNVSWMIPTIQTVHILAIAVVVGSVCMVDLRVLGAAGRTMPLAAVVARFVPWIWYALIVLLASGSLLIIAEPNRSLQNPAFQLKVLMILAVVALTLLFARPLRSNASFWEASPGRRAAAVALAVLSIVLWSSIVFAGRWIAYVSSY